MNLGIWLFVLAILVVVMVHEAGHFLAAKYFNFKATQFFVGFGPTLFSRKKGETEYGVKALPLGGFVKIVGMNPYEEIPPEEQHRSYPNKPRWQRAIVLISGSATHWPVAFVILLIAAMAFGYPTGEPSNQLSAVEARVFGQETPAEAAGFQLDDTIVAIDGERVTSWGEVRSFIRANPGEAVTFTVERDGRRETIDAELGTGIVSSQTDELLALAPAGEDVREAGDGEQEVGYLGVGPQPEIKSYGFGEAITHSGERVWDMTVRSVIGVPQVFAQVFNGDIFEALGGEGERSAEDSPIGIVGASRIVGESSNRGEYTNILEMIAAFTIFVGLMNLLPLPPLDGGHLAVVAWEAVTKRTVDIRKLIPVSAAVIGFFIILFVAILYLDLARPVDLPF
ncbi:MAG TPA: site-2 protease family protein [Actinomycetota bacterium]|nr:site-2 protease family protein [Actinomycetota bacterium]